MLSKVIEARHEAPCPSCGTRIYEGDPIVHDDEADGWVHAGRCGSGGVLDEPKNPLCRSCWVYHAGPCE